MAIEEKAAPTKSYSYEYNGTVLYRVIQLISIRVIRRQKVMLDSDLSLHARHSVCMKLSFVYGHLNC
jgi:hypothetical protein